MSANKEIVRRAVEGVWRDRNLAIVDELIALDYVGYDPTQPAPIQGSKGYREFVAIYQSAFDDATVTIDDQVAEGDQVVTRCQRSKNMSATQSGSLISSCSNSAGRCPRSTARSRSTSRRLGAASSSGLPTTSAGDGGATESKASRHRN